MKTKVICLLIFIAAIDNIFGQVMNSFIVMAKGDSAVIYLIEPPKSTQGFLVYRKASSDTGSFKLLTNEAIKPVINPHEARSIIGVYWDKVTQALRTEDPFEVLRKLRSNELYGGLLSMLNSSVAKVTGRWFLDTTAAKGKRYIYKVAIVDGKGKELKTFSDEVTLKEIYPAPPSKLKPEISDGKVTIKWFYPKWENNFDDLAVQFYIYRKSGDNKYLKVNRLAILRDNANDPQYEDIWLENKQVYYYYVTAVDPVGRESKPSEVIKVEPIDNVPPEIPVITSSDASDNKAGLMWNMSPELDAAGYNVYRSLGFDKKFAKLNKSLIPVDKPYYVDSTITNGVQFFYAVTALDKNNNESKKSNSIALVCADRNRPDAPAGLIFKLDKRILNLTWKASKSKDVAGYYVYRGESKEIQPRITSKPVTANSFEDKGYNDYGLTPGRNFIISVTAIDSANNESEKASINVLVPDDDPPLPPGEVIADNIEGRYVNVNCGISPSLDAANYIFYRSEEGQKPVKLRSQIKAPFLYSDTSVQKGNSYIYSVFTEDTAKNVSVSAAADTIRFVDFSPPTAVKNLNATITEKGIELNWEQVIDFDMAGYNVYRAKIPNGIYEKLNSSPFNELTFIDTTGNKEYFYKVLAVDTSGNESEAESYVQAK